MSNKAKNTTTDNEQITESASIVRILKQLTTRNTPLTVQIADRNASYTSYTVGVEKSHLLLDELIPTTGHQILLEERNITVSSKLDGVDIHFNTSLVSVDEQDKVLTYRMSLPKQLEYHQRRQDYRVHIPMSKLLRVFILDRADTMHEATLHDISHGGAGLVFTTPANTIESGQIYGFAFELPNDVWLYCFAEICHSKTIPPKNRQLIGIKFVELSPAQPRLLRRFISQLEREIIKKR